MVQVECYAGYKPDERPLRFCTNGRQYEIDRVLTRWRGRDAEGFRVSTPQGIFELRHHLTDDTWAAEPWPRSTS
jgi:hypothetical protein